MKPESRNGGHNLFMNSPQVTVRIKSLVPGETVSTDEIVVDLPIPPM